MWLIQHICEVLEAKILYGDDLWKGRTSEGNKNIDIKNAREREIWKEKESNKRVHVKE